MAIVKGILIAVYIIVAIILIILTLMQTKDDAGLSSTITGSSTNNFYEKNKGRTKEGKLKKWTIILGIVFVVLAVVLGILFVGIYSIKKYVIKN